MKKSNCFLRATLLFMICSAFVNGNAQITHQAKIDSLREQISEYNSPCLTPCILDSVKVNRMIDLAWEYNFNKTDTVLTLSNEALVLAQKINYPVGIAQVYHVMANFYNLQGDYSNALKLSADELTVLNKLVNSRQIAKLIQSKKAACFNTMANVCKNQGNYLKAIDYFQEALTINEKYNNLGGIAINNKNIGDIYTSWGSFPKALNCFYKALSLAEQLGKENIAAACLGSIGLIHRRQNAFDKAIEYYTKALLINKRMNDKRAVGVNLGQLGASYREKTDYSRAFECFNNALELFTEVKYKTGIASIQSSLGDLHLERAIQNDKDSKFDSSTYNRLKALECFQKASKVQEALGRNSYMATYLGNIGVAYLALGKKQDAEKYMSMSQELFNSLGDLDGLKWINKELSDFYQAMGNYEKAFNYYKKSVGANDSLFNEKNIEEMTSIRMSYEFEKKEALAKAEFDKQIAVNEADKLRGIAEADKRRTLIELNKNIELAAADKKLTEAETNKRIAISEADKKRLIAELDKENIRIVSEKQMADAKAENEKQKLLRNSIAGGAGVILLSSFLIFFFYKRKRDADQKQKETALSLQVSETEMKALRSQMNPHFIFNALQSIQTFLISHQPEDANNYLLKFSKLMRLVLENSQHSEVPIKDDMQALELYMQLESIRLAHPFTFQIHIGDAIDIEETTIPPLILQPFVENAIWHGLQYKTEPGHIDIFISKRDNALYATVEDNGVGRDTARLSQQPILMKKKSLGMKLTEERLHILNELKNIKAQFKITDLFTKNNQPAGTKVELSLPLAS